MSEPIYFDARINFQKFDSDLSEADRKVAATSTRMASKGVTLRLGVDTKKAEADVEGFLKRVGPKLNLRGSVSLDTSSAEAQINKLASTAKSILNMGGGFGSAGYAGPGVVQNRSNTFLGAIQVVRPQSAPAIRSGGSFSTSPGGQTSLTSAGVSNNNMVLTQPARVTGSVNLSNTTFGENSRQLNLAANSFEGYAPAQAAKVYQTAGASNRGFAFNPLSLVTAQNLRGAYSGTRNALTKVGNTQIGLGSFGGAAFAAAGSVYAGAQYLSDIADSGSSAIRNQQAIAAGRVFDADTLYNSSINSNQTGPKENRTVNRVVGNIPIVNGIARGINNFRNGEMLASAEVQRNNSDNARLDVRNLNQSIAQRKVLETDDIFGKQKAQAQLAVLQSNGGFDDQIKSMQDRGDPASKKIIGKLIAEKAAAAKAIVEQSDQDIARQMKVLDTQSRSSRRISNLSGVDDREAEREAIRSQYIDRLNNPTSSIRDQAKAELDAKLDDRDRSYNRETGFMGQQNAVDRLSSQGFGLQSQLAQNKLNADRQLVGVKDQGRIDQVRDAQKIADDSAVKEFNISLREMASSTKSASLALGGNGLAAKLEQINSQEQSALEKNPEMKEQIKAAAEVQRLGAKIESAQSKANFALGTKAIANDNKRQRMRNNGNFIAAEAEGIYDDAEMQIERLNLDNSLTNDERSAQIGKIKEGASLKAEGIKKGFVNSLTTEEVSAYQIAGGAGGRNPLAQKALEDIQNLGAQMAGGDQRLEAAADNRKDVGDTSNGITKDQGDKLIEALQKLIINTD